MAEQGRIRRVRHDHLDDDVTGSPSQPTGMTASFEPDLLAVSGTLRNRDEHRSLLEVAPVALAVPARVGDDPAVARAGRAGPIADEPSLRVGIDIPRAPGAAARRTDPPAEIRPRTPAVTGIAL